MSNLENDYVLDIQNRMRTIYSSIILEAIDRLHKNNFIVQLSKNLALYYSKLPQLAGQLKQDQLETVIKNYLNQAAKTNPGFNKLFGSIMTLLDSVSTRMKASKTKPKQIWIGITSTICEFNRYSSSLSSSWSNTKFENLSVNR